jgi:hypothetical protein
VLTVFLSQYQVDVSFAAILNLILGLHVDNFVEFEFVGAFDLADEKFDV